MATLLIGKFLENDALVGDRGEIVGRGPVLGAVLDAPVHRAGLECFDGDGGVAEIVEAQLVEIVDAEIDVERARPIVRHAFIDDAAAGLEFLDAIGAGAERRLERGRTDVAGLAVLVGALPPGFGKNRELPDDLRQGAMAGAVEGERDLAIAGFFRLHHLVVIGHRLRIRFLERGERENDVVGRDRRAVMPFCFRPQPKRHGRKIVRIAQRFGQEAVSGRDFVERLRQQRVVKEIGALNESAFDQPTTGLKLSNVPSAICRAEPPLGALALT